MLLPKQLRQLIGALGSALAFASAGALAAEHAVHEHGHGSAAGGLTLNDGRKWTGDEALRKGMENIRNTLDASLRQIHEGKLSTAGYTLLAKKLGDELGGIVANCKLEAQADAQLHLVIADLATGIETLEGRTKKVKRQAGALKILAALEKYGNHFEHPGWTAIKH